MGVRQIVDGDAVRIFVPVALGLQVDGAAEGGAAGRGTEQEVAGAVQYLDLVIEFGRDELARRHAVETVDRDILAVQRETANHELLRGIAEAERGAHRRVVLEHCAQRQRLLVEVRSEERRFGNGCVGTCRLWWSPSL